ncbi:MAG: endonuclease/exonuclease/phosphatase family protein, partial [Pseudomonadota bacterium]
TFEDASSGELVTVAVNHLKSKGSSTGAAGDENIGDGAGASNGTRTEGARILADWLAADPTGTGAENQLILGDLNAYAEEDPLDVLAAAGFVDVAAELIGEEAYSFVFDGQIGTLDYILANGPAFEALTGVTEWHINADEADAIDYNIEITTLSDGTVVTRDPAIFDGDTAARNSDHDPVIAGFSFDSGELLEIVGTPNRDRLFGTDAGEKFIGLGGPDVMTGRGGGDVFVATRSVTIADFGNGDDRIDLSEAGVASFDQLVFVQNGSRTTVIDTESGLRFGVVGVEGPAELTEESFIFAPPAGGELILGTDGNDALVGGAGDDTLDGGAGSDAYRGNGGADVFVLGVEGRDLVLDFTPGEDALDVSAFGATGLEDLRFAERPAAGLIEIFGPAGAARLKTTETGATLADLDADAFVFADALLS